jgi:hypothetical protein
MGCACKTPRGVPRTRVVTPAQLNARRTGLGVTPTVTAPAAVAPSVAPLGMVGGSPVTGSQSGMVAERRAAEKKRRDTLRNKLGR